MELKGFIYDWCSDSNQADIFTKTTKEVAKNVGQTYKYGSNTRLAVESRQTVFNPAKQSTIHCDKNRNHNMGKGSS
jgi:hypothetical protein